MPIDEGLSNGRGWSKFSKANQTRKDNEQRKIRQKVLSLIPGG